MTLDEYDLRVKALATKFQAELKELFREAEEAEIDSEVAFKLFEHEFSKVFGF